MKKILFLLLLSVSIYGQTYQNPTFGTVTTKTSPTVTNDPYLTTTGTAGVQGKIAPVNVLIPYTPINYTISGQTIGQQIAAIDAKIGTMGVTSAGLTQRVDFTADNTVVNAVTYFASSLIGKGSTASGSPPALVLPDNTKAFFTKDVISIAQPAPTIGYAGVYSGNLTVSATPTPVATKQRFTVEIYRTDNLGNPIASGVSGAPVGDLGFTVLAILDSGELNLTAGSITNIPVSGRLTQNVTINTGERLRYHVSAAKIGAGGGNVTFGVYYGTSYNSYYDVPVAITTDAVLNKSAVAGAITATDALNTLNGGLIYKRTIAQIRALTGTLPSNNFYTTDLGQEGNWYYDASDVSSTDNTGTILVTADGKRIKRIINGGVNIKWFGAKGNSTFAYARNQVGATAGNDDGTAIQNAISYCLTTGQKLYVPVGIYRTTSAITVTYPNGLTMEGEGKPFEISLNEYTNGTSPLYKGVYFMRDYTGAPLFTFRGGLLSSDPDWANYRDGKMWKTDIKNVGFMERSGGGGQPNPTTNSTSLVLAKRSILMRFKNCVFIGGATSNFEGFQIDDSVFDDCRFISGGSNIVSPNMLLHRVTTISGETPYSEATNSLTFIACIFEGNNGRNLLTAPASYTRADGTVFTESGSISALQILGGIFKYPNLRSSSGLNNVELNNVSSANCSFAISHKGCIDTSVSTSSEILKIFNSFNSYFNVQAEKLANANFTLTNFINVTGGTSINIDTQLFDSTSGIAGTEGVTISGGSLNVVTGSLSTVTGTKILTNNHIQFFPNKTAPSASAGGVTIYANTSNKLSTIDNAGTVSGVAGEALDNVYTAKNTYQPSITPTATIARPFYVKPTLTATANNDFLYGFTFEPIFNTAGFTGVKRLFNIILGGGTFQLAGSAGSLEVGPSGDNLFFGKAGLNIIDAIGTGASLLLRGNSYVGIGDASTNYMRLLMSDGSLLLQNGGIYTSNGVDRLQVQGTASGTVDATNANQFVRYGQVSGLIGNTSGRYTPTAVAGTNVTSITAPTTHTYTKIGNIVTVYGYTVPTLTTTAIDASYTITLPIARANTGTFAIGFGATDSPSNTTKSIFINSSTTTTATIMLTSTLTGGVVCRYSFQYDVTQ